jgi:hypothetical protein
VGLWALLQDAKAFPSRLLWDNESGICQRRPTEPVTTFAGSLDVEISGPAAYDGIFGIDLDQQPGPLLEVSS